NHAFKVKDLTFSVTVSIGGSLKDAYDGVEQAINEADEALYRAKEHGRNQTIFANTTKRRRKKSVIADEQLVA
ncbi:MAG: diguanylate cyclase, partial [Pseudomonadota bacterium]